jgi:hypothetical protein
MNTIIPPLYSIVLRSTDYVNKDTYLFTRQHGAELFAVGTTQL